MEIKVCPSCGSSEIEVAGNKVHCKGCDITYKVTQDGARVDNLDPLDKDRQRINKLETDIEELKRGKNQTTDKDDAEAIDEEPVGFLRDEPDDETEETDAGDEKDGTDDTSAG